ncbi:hypothetical protein Trco_008203 [Trichoderma cornu-damae]|uniref:RNase MRP protein 1 RNA binding domain-containing protein n=1 Tax=Trichoderma cornu-damae TaxID=654480 RepID=A0A9P8TSS6_9HYPO|nr:hypothetical protein Trco_008203 [Trichoderma cornu-damae]
MSAAPTSSARSSAAAALSPLLPILSAFNHRHHNQHRSAHWWPVFRILRRAIRSLVDDLSPSPSPFSFSSSSSSSSSSSPPPPPRAVWLNKHLVPRAYIAFTQLAADNQHAPLGLLLLAVLSRIHTALSRLLADSLSPPSASTPAKAPPSDRAGDAAGQDRGVAIARRGLAPPAKDILPQCPSDDQQTKPPNAESRDASSSSSRDKEKRKKKKKGKGDQLSSLFGSLA